MTAEAPLLETDELGRSPCILVVDPDAPDRELARRLLEAEGHEVAFAATGDEALARVAELRPAAALIDMNLPDLDGLELIRTLRKKHPLTAMVLMTEQGSDELAFKALKCGAASYVPKRTLESELSTTMEMVLSAAETDRRRHRLMSCLTASELHFTLGNDPALIPSVIALFQESVAGMGLIDEASSVRLGIALEEAILNAMYHGNLEVSSELRQDGDEPYRDLIEQRRKLPPYSQRRVYISLKLTREEAAFTIKDEGPGFDPTSLPDPTDPANLESTSGRGLLLIRTFMDEVKHNAAGNQITMIKRRDNGRRCG